MQTFAAFDLETTGFPGHGQIIQLAAVRFGPDGRVIDKLQMYVHPTSPIPVKITQLTGITDADVRWARPAAEAVAIFKEFTAGDILVGHNAVSFDGSFIADVDPSMKGRLIVDTLTASRLLLPNQSHKLTDLTQQFGIVQTNAHQAWSDAEATGDLLAHLVHLARKLDPAQLDALKQDPKAQNPSMNAFFNTIVPRTRTMPLNVPLEQAANPDAPSAQRSDVSVTSTDGPTPTVHLAGNAPDLMSFRIAGIQLAGSQDRDSALNRTMRAIKIQPRVTAVARRENGHRAVSAIYAQNHLRSQHPAVARHSMEMRAQALAS